MTEQQGDTRHLDALDRDLKRFSNLETATGMMARPMVGLGVSLVFVLLAGIAAMLLFGQENNTLIVVIDACLGAYMVLNIGANDVANNMGPAVGANALSMGGAIAIAVIFESAGALIAGGDVVSTIAKGIIAPESMGTASVFIWAMMSALLSAALWVNLATWVGAPVSTTHSVVGGVMAGTFAAYLALKGLKKIIAIDMPTALMIGAAIGVLVWLVMIPLTRKQSQGLGNRNKSLKVLFGIPLVVSAALLSFAHGANDVANAVGPLAAIVQVSQSGDFTQAVSIPFWVMVIGAFGISFGLFLFGPKLIKMVGGQITKLNPMRAYCVALSAANTVIVASWLGLPVSSTHIAVGAVFGVGFFREWDAERRIRLARLTMPNRPNYAPQERRRRKLVRRSHFVTIIAARLITVPAAAILSAIIFFLIDVAMG